MRSKYRIRASKENYTLGEGMAEDSTRKLSEFIGKVKRLADQMRNEDLTEEEAKEILSQWRMQTAKKPPPKQIKAKRKREKTARKKNRS